MKLYIGSKAIEIRHAIQKARANIQWLKRRLLIVSRSPYGVQSVEFYTQKIETQEALIDYLAKYEDLDNQEDSQAENYKERVGVS
jgi:hypothetical protein